MQQIHSNDVSNTKIQKEIQLFNNPEFGELRINQDENENIWFSLNDVMKSLGLSHVSNLRKRLLSKGCITITAPTKGGNQEMIFIDEPNLYRCIFQSRKEEAEKFQDWVFEEVLPTIRKTGGYMASFEADTPETIMARALVVAESTLKRHAEEVIAERRLRFEAEKQKAQIEQQKNIVEGKNEILEKENEYLAPKAQYTDEVLQSASTFTTSQIAQSLGMSAILLNKKLNLAGIQYKQSGQWMLYAKHRDHGYANIRVSTYVNRRTDEIESTQSLVWTEKGRLFIHDLKKGGKI